MQWDEEWQRAIQDFRDLLAEQYRTRRACIQQLHYVGKAGISRFIRTVAMHVLKFVASGPEQWDVNELETESRTAYLINIVASLYVQSDMILGSRSCSIDSIARELSMLLTYYGKGFSMIGPTWCTAMIETKTTLHGVDVSQKTAASTPQPFSDWQLLIDEGVHRAACAIVQSGFDAGTLHQLLRPESGCGGVVVDMLQALAVCKHVNPWQSLHKRHVKPYGHDLYAAMTGPLREAILDRQIEARGAIDSADVDLVLTGYVQFDDRRRVAFNWMHLLDLNILARLLQSDDICDNLVAACEFCTSVIPAQHPVYDLCRVEKTCKFFAELMVTAAATLPPASTGIRSDLIGLWDFGDSKFTTATWRDAVHTRMSKRAARMLSVNDSIMRKLFSRSMDIADRLKVEESMLP